MVTSPVMRDPDICMTVKGLYAYMCTYADPHTNALNVGISRMADEMGVTQSTIKRCIKTLLDKGIVSRNKKSDSKTLVTTLLK